MHRVYIIKGINPTPYVAKKIKTQKKYPIQGCDMIYNALGENTLNSWKHFKTYFGCQYPYRHDPNREDAQNWKVQPILHNIHESPKDTIHMV